MVVAAITWSAMHFCLVDKQDMPHDQVTVEYLSDKHSACAGRGNPVDRRSDGSRLEERCVVAVLLTVMLGCVTSQLLT
jgi:hypothetical protein